MKKHTTIAVSFETIEKIRNIGKLGQTYEDVINSLLKFYEKKSDNGEQSNKTDSITKAITNGGNLT